MTRGFIEVACVAVLAFSLTMIVISVAIYAIRLLVWPTPAQRNYNKAGTNRARTG